MCPRRTCMSRWPSSARPKTPIPYDRKKFVPHVTIIRNMGGPWKKVSPPKADMTVKKVSLMKSEQKNGKQVYTEIFSVDLGGKA